MGAAILSNSEKNRVEEKLTSFCWPAIEECIDNGIKRKHMNDSIVDACRTMLETERIQLGSVSPPLDPGTTFALRPHGVPVASGMKLVRLGLGAVLDRPEFDLERDASTITISAESYEDLTVQHAVLGAAAGEVNELLDAYRQGDDLQRRIEGAIGKTRKDRRLRRITVLGVVLAAIPFGGWAADRADLTVPFFQTVEPGPNEQVPDALGPLLREQSDSDRENGPAPTGILDVDRNGTEQRLEELARVAEDETITPTIVEPDEGSVGSAQITPAKSAPDSSQSTAITQAAQTTATTEVESTTTTINRETVPASEPTPGDVALAQTLVDRLANDRVDGGSQKCRAVTTDDLRVDKLARLGALVPVCTMASDLDGLALWSPPDNQPRWIGDNVTMSINGVDYPKSVSSNWCKRSANADIAYIDHWVGGYATFSTRIGLRDGSAESADGGPISVDLEVRLDGQTVIARQKYGQGTEQRIANMDISGGSVLSFVIYLTSEGSCGSAQGIALGEPILMP